MRKRSFLAGLLILFAVEILMVVLFAFRGIDNRQDAVLVNEVVRSVQADWDLLTGGRIDMDSAEFAGKLEYVVLNGSGEVLYRTRPDLSESINGAVIHRDTILDITVEGQTVGKIIINNDSGEFYRKQSQAMILIILAAMLLQCAVCIGYLVYLNRVIIRPFQHLEGFAERMAGGNMDMPLMMEEQNLFGAFTESFDIMRSELKKARTAEARANSSKKELVAKLSHDIKTPVASIKAVAEVGTALADNERIRNHYIQIIRKADQINTLITNLFTATLEELRQLTIAPEDMESKMLRDMLGSADYLHQAVIPEIPDCLLRADPLRLQQVFDNIFANSYKYAGTQIMVKICREERRLNVCIQDYGKGVREEELPLLKEKFKRGSNAEHIEGAGLGLYISDYFMREMGGALMIRNGEEGFEATVGISLSGDI